MDMTGAYNSSGGRQHMISLLRALSPAEMLSESQTAPLNSETSSGPIVDGRIVAT